MSTALGDCGRDGIRTARLSTAVRAGSGFSVIAKPFSVPGRNSLHNPEMGAPCSSAKRLPPCRPTSSRRSGTQQCGRLLRRSPHPPPPTVSPRRSTSRRTSYVGPEHLSTNVGGSAWADNSCAGRRRWPTGGDRRMSEFRLRVGGRTGPRQRADCCTNRRTRRGRSGFATLDSAAGLRKPA